MTKDLLTIYYLKIQRYSTLPKKNCIPLKKLIKLMIKNQLIKFLSMKITRRKKGNCLDFAMMSDSF